MMLIVFWRNNEARWLVSSGTLLMLLLQKKIKHFIISLEQKWSMSLFLKKKMKWIIISSDKNQAHNYLFLQKNIKCVVISSGKMKCLIISSYKKHSTSLFRMQQIKRLIISAEKNQAHHSFFRKNPAHHSFFRKKKHFFLMN